MSHPEKPNSPIRFAPLSEADPASWRRLVAANPVATTSVGDTAAHQSSSEQPNMELLEDILAGRTSADIPGSLNLGSATPYLVSTSGELAGVAEPPAHTPVEAPEVQRVLDDEANAPDATTSQHIIISMAAEREKRTKERRRRGPLFGGIAAAAAAIALLVGLGQVIPGGAPLSRAEAQTLLRNAGAEARNDAVNVQKLPTAALYLHRREVVRHFNKDGIIYNVTTTQRTIMDAANVETQVSRGEVSFDSPEAKAKWEKAGSPKLFGLGRGYTKRGTQQVQIGGSTINVAALHSWPTDPTGLSNVLANAIPGVQPSRSALLLLTIPGLDGPFYHGLYQVVAREAGSTIVPTPAKIRGAVPKNAVTVKFAPNKVSTTTATLTFDPRSGQVYAVEGATPQDTLVLVRSTGFLNCIQTEGPQGPKNIYMGCATGAFMLTEITWQDWGEKTAKGEGVAVINDCDPACATGKKHRLPVIVKLSHLESCGYGVQIYTHLEATFPKGTKGLVSETVHEEFPCPEVPHGGHE